MKKCCLILTLILLTGCNYVNTNSVDEEDKSAAIESVEKENDEMDRKKCIVGEIISVEEDYVYIKGAKEIYYNVYTDDVSKYTVGNELYVYYDEKKELEENLYMLKAEKVEESKPEKEIPKL